MNFDVNLELILAGTLVVLGIRTFFWHLQCWQIREYRWDRLNAYLRTKEGIKNFWNLWFFRGVFPRPQKSGRIFMILGLFLLVHIVITCLLYEVIFQLLIFTGIWEWTGYESFFPSFTNWFGVSEYLFLGLLLSERFIFLSVFSSVLLSQIPVNISKKILFKKAAKIIEKADENIVKIGITGSYGKSSTKEILVHLLVSEFGNKNVLYNPANENTEVAIARLILRNKKFLQPRSADLGSKDGSKNRKFIVIETGAYKKGEIAQVCKFLQPHFGILTGLNQQHVELFGSIENTGKAKFELAKSAQNSVFFNADNAYLTKIFEDHEIKATKIPISQSVAKNIEGKSSETHFEAYGQNFLLPWPGKFFVQNALLALECAREQGVKIKNLSEHLKSLPPLKRALNLEVHPQKFTILRDLYSANPDGVLAAIDHLANFKGQKIFVSIPLLELGQDSRTIHRMIFEKLESIDAKVFWCKEDFSEMGREILGENFHKICSRGHETLVTLEKMVKNLGKNDAVLLESKLPQNVLKIFG